MTENCAWCGIPRVQGPVCPDCGADYAKAAAIKARQAGLASAPKAEAAPESEPESLLTIHDAVDDWARVKDPNLEWQLCIGVIPAMLVIGMLFQATGAGASIQRIALGMPVHELGHAVTAWLCGYNAIPSLWKTLVPDNQGYILPLVWFGSITAMTLYAHSRQYRAFTLLGIGLLLMQALGTFWLAKSTTSMLITFGGDGVGMVLATMLMTTFFFGKNNQLYRGWLRWGFVGIGAAAFVDIYSTWRLADTDMNKIPYGLTGGLHTDSYKLVNYHGWSMRQLVDRYLYLGNGCLIALAMVYAWGINQAREHKITRQRDDRLARLKGIDR